MSDRISATCMMMWLFGKLLTRVGRVAMDLPPRWMLSWQTQGLLYRVVFQGQGPQRSLFLKVSNMRPD
jgi:hypothetical protein